MALVADYQTLRAVLRYSDLPDSGANTGDRIIVASIKKVARWSGSAWVLSSVEVGLASDQIASTIAALLVGTLSGTADGTMESIGATNGGDVSGAISNNFKECFTQINAILVSLKAAGLMA